MHRLLLTPLLLTLGLLAITARPVVAADEWTKGVPYTTSWDDAITQCRETGRMLFIYNGWQREGI